MPMTTSGYLTYKDAAEYLGLSRKTLERAVADKRIPHVRDPLTGRVRFHTADLDKWMTTGRGRGRAS